jgi:hypothetical protein
VELLPFSRRANLLAVAYSVLRSPTLTLHKSVRRIKPIERNRSAVAGRNPCVVLETSIRAARGTGRASLLDFLESTGS